MADQGTLFERVSKSFTELSIVAADLNVVSDELGAYVVKIDDSLRKLNLGVTVWVSIRNWHDHQSGDYAADRLGYAKTGNKWGISLQKAEGNYAEPDQEEAETWLFSDAPRALRLAAIDHMPVMLDTLAKEAATASKNIRAKLSDVQEVASAMNPGKKDAAIVRAEAGAALNAIAVKFERSQEALKAMKALGGVK